MKRIVLIACASKKKPYQAKARELYDSDLFRLSLRFAEEMEPDEIYILSAKHGLLHPDLVIEPYDVTLNDFPESRIKRWAIYVLGQLAMVSDVRRDQFIILAGDKYRKYLTPYLGSYTVPLEGKRIGEQLHFLKKMTGVPITSTVKVLRSKPTDYQQIREKDLGASNEKRKLEALLAFSKTIDPKELFPSLVPGATEFAINDPYAFALATCLDRGTKADIIWTIPYYIRENLGHLDPYRIHKMTNDQLMKLFYELPQRPRYVDAAPRTVKELTSLVIKNYDGDASRMWSGKKASEVNSTFRSIWGVGPGIASMAVLLIEKAFGIRFSDLDRRKMDIKPDVHTMRVLYRMGLSPKQSEEAAVAAARELNPSYPGELDAPLWIIGRRWCSYSNPSCQRCWMRDVCPKKL